MIKLDNEVTFYVPSTVEGSKKISNSGFIARSKRIATLLSNLCGGATIINGTGAYTMNDGQLVTEQVKLVSASLTSDQLPIVTKSVINLAKLYKDVWSQESIAVKINNTLYIVE